MKSKTKSKIIEKHRTTDREGNEVVYIEDIYQDLENNLPIFKNPPPPPKPRMFRNEKEILTQEECYKCKKWNNLFERCSYLNNHCEFKQI